MKKIISGMVALITLALPAFAKDDLKTNYRTAIVMAYSPANNIYEDENICLEIYNESLWAINKTDKTIFIDLSQSFLNHNGSSYPMLEKSQGEKSASRNKISSSQEEFISIAPSIGGKQNPTFICYLSGAKLYGKYSTSESPSGSFSSYEERLLNIINDLISESLAADPKNKNMIGSASRHLLEDETVNGIGASLAYAFNKRSEDWTPITISTWVSDIYMVPFYVEMPKELSKNEKRGFGVKKTEAAKIHLKADSPFEFDVDKSPIIVCDWIGDFKKGEFDLRDTKISKNKMSGLGLAMMAIASAGASLLMDPAETTYKSEIIFDGSDADWGKMTYMDNKDLSKFNNKR